MAKVLPAARASLLLLAIAACSAGGPQTAPKPGPGVTKPSVAVTQTSASARRSTFETRAGRGAEPGARCAGSQNAPSPTAP